VALGGNGILAGPWPSSRLKLYPCPIPAGNRVAPCFSNLGGLCWLVVVVASR